MSISIRGSVKRLVRDFRDPEIPFPKILNFEAVAVARGWHFEEVYPSTVQCCPGARAMSEDFLPATANVTNPDPCCTFDLVNRPRPATLHAALPAAHAVDMHQARMPPPAKSAFETAYGAWLRNRAYVCRSGCCRCQSWRSRPSTRSSRSRQRSCFPTGTACRC